MQGNPRQSWIRRGFRILGTGFLSLSVDLGFWIPIVSGIPDSTSKNFPDSETQIPLLRVSVKNKEVLYHQTARLFASHRYKYQKML